MWKLKEQGYKDMHPFILDKGSQDCRALTHRSAGNTLGVSRKFDEKRNFVKRAEVRTETKWCKEVHNQSTIDPGLPELVAFLQETSVSSERHPSHGKCRVRGCELDHNAISCILDSDVTSGSRAIRRSLWAETSTSYVVEFKANQVLRKDRIEIRCPEQVAMEKGVDVHVEGKIPVKHISPEMSPIHRHIPGETSATPISAASYIAAAIEHNVPPNINQREDCPWSSEFANAFEVEGKVRLGSAMSETRTKSGEITIKKQVRGDAYFSAASPMASPPTEWDTAPYSPTISVYSRSNSSTTSSKSFSFPILPSEWNGSPVKMAKADRTKLHERRNKPWWTYFVCCKQMYIGRCDSDDEIAHKILK